MGGGIWGGGGKVEMINGKGCSRRFFDFSSSFRGLQSSFLESMSPASSAIPESPAKSDGPLSGLVICVTGLSKETRKQVKEATERLGGQYSPHLHPRCTHLVVQSFRGHKFEHALKHGSANGLFLVTLSWFVDSIKRNVRLNESLYSINNIGGMGIQADDLKRLNQNTGAENSFNPASLVKHMPQNDALEDPISCFPERESKKPFPSFCSGQSFFVDSDVPAELRCKVVEALSVEGASLISQWFVGVGCNASHVVCEGDSVRRYLEHSMYAVTPLWVLKSAKEKSQQRLVHLSADLARFIGVVLDTFHDGVSREEHKRLTSPENMSVSVPKRNQEERQLRVNLVKDGVRKRRSLQMQECQTPIHPITRSRLLDSINWSVSEPTSTASRYTDSLSVDYSADDQASRIFDAKLDGKETENSFVNLSRPLTESEKSEIIFKNHFLTILFPIDRFSEIGPSSRTYFSEKGFRCLQVLDHIYSFYQENMSAEEIEMAIHTDSRHADRLRSAWCSKEAAEVGCVRFKRIDFLGSRRSFEMLKRMSGDNNRTVYELLIRA